MSTVLRQMPQHVAHLPRTGHNLNQSFGFTASTGMILPTYYDQLNVGETVFINSKLFARTQPLVVPAMADVDFYLDWFLCQFLCSISYLLLFVIRPTIIILVFSIVKSISLV